MFLPTSESWTRSVRALAVGTAMALTALAFVIVPAAAQQTGSILGRVTSSGGPLTGVGIDVLGTTRTSVTNVDGRYLIVGVPPGTYQVRASVIGYAPGEQEVTVSAGGQATADFQLQTSSVELEGLVVTGTAIAAQRREIGNSIELITAQQIADVGATSVGEILRGRVAGLGVSGSLAAPGVGAELNIRGVTSINGRRAPLIYVDGVRVGTENGSFDPATGESGAATVLGSISPHDIARIEIIKGAAATTLYGTDATAGVIQIFTKRGAPGENARWTFSTQQSLSRPTMFGPGEDIDPTGLHLNRCDINGPLPQDTIPGPDPDCPESGSWFKDAWSQDYGLQVRGGAESFGYFVSGNVQLQEGIINAPDTHPGAQAENVFLRANFSFSPWESMDVRISNAYTRRDISFVPIGELGTSLSTNVTMLTEGDAPGDHDAQVFLQTEEQVIDQFTTSATLNWVPRDNLRHRFTAGFDRSNSNRINEFKRGHFDEEIGARTVDIETNRVITLDYAGSLSWQVPGLDDAYSMTSSWGGQLNDRQEGGLRGDAEGFINRGRTQTEQGAEITNLNESYDAFINWGLFAQQQIGWNNMIFLTGGLRFDTYATVNAHLESVPQYQLFPKLQATYSVSDHAWFPDVFDVFRLRGAWGAAGDPPPQTASRTLWDIRATGRGNTGYVVNQIGNTDIGPERTSEWELGADVSALQGRLNLSGQYFHRKTDDGVIFNDPIPSLGIQEPTPANVGEWTTWGYEVTLDANLLEMDGFRWGLNSTFSSQDSEVQNIGRDEDGSFNVGGGNNDGTASYRPGFPLASVFRERILNPNERGALPVYTDTAEFIGVQFAPYSLSVATSFTIGSRLTLDFFGHGQFGHILLDGQVLDLAEDGLWPACVRTNALMDDWRAAGAEESALPTELTALDIARCDEVNDPDTRDWFDEADFFRFSSASAQYRVPENWLPSSLTGATVQFQMLNLNLFTDFVGTDPDALRGAGLQRRFRGAGFVIPLPRTYSLNLRLNF